MTSLKIAEGDIPQLEGTVAIISGGHFLAELLDKQILTLVKALRMELASLQQNCWQQRAPQSTTLISTNLKRQLLELHT